MTLFSIFLLLLALLPGTQNDSKQGLDTVMQLEQRFSVALLKRDAAEFEELLADDLVHIGFEGQIAGKRSTWVSSRMASGSIRSYHVANLKHQFYRFRKLIFHLKERRDAL